MVLAQKKLCCTKNPVNEIFRDFNKQCNRSQEGVPYPGQVGEGGYMSHICGAYLHPCLGGGYPYPYFERIWDQSLGYPLTPTHSVEQIEIITFPHPSDAGSDRAQVLCCPGNRCSYCLFQEKECQTPLRALIPVWSWHLAGTKWKTSSPASPPSTVRCTNSHMTSHMMASRTAPCLLSQVSQEILFSSSICKLGWAPLQGQWASL